MIDLTRLPPASQDSRLMIQVGDSEPIDYETAEAYNAAIDATRGAGWIRVWRELLDGTQQCKGRYWR